MPAGHKKQDRREEEVDIVAKTIRTAKKRWWAAAVPAVVAAAVVALGGLVVADGALAQPPGGHGARAGRMGRQGGPGGGPGGRLMFLRAVDLSEAQRGQIRNIHEQNGEATRAVNERVRVARRALQDAVTADVVNEGAIRAVAHELGLAEGDAAVQQAYLHSQVWQMLTPEQQEQARAAEAEMARRMEHRQQRRGERRERRQERQGQG